MDTLVNSYLYWGVSLVIGLPLCIIILNESIDRLNPKYSDYTPLLHLLRDVILPLLVLLMLLRLVFAIDVSSVTANLVSTLFWSTVIILIFRFSRVFLGSGDYAKHDWRSKIPQLFLSLPPYVLIGIIVFHVIQDIWALPVKEMAATLGIGSIAIAFALQTTLSNLVSGLLLVANSPFKVGEWVTIGDVEGQVLDINWRYTQIKNWSGDLVLIPNGSISEEHIENHHRPDNLTAAEKTLGFDSSVPPNQVKNMLYDTLSKTPGVLTEPDSLVMVSELDNPVAQYTVEFWVDDFESKPEIIADFLGRVWYAARRENISIPKPAQEFYAQRTPAQAVINTEELNARKQILNQLSLFSHFSDASLIQLSKDATLKHYADTERILDEGDKESGVFIITKGSVQLEKNVGINTPVKLEKLSIGGLFGENGLFGRAISNIDAIDLENSEIMVIQHDKFNRRVNVDIQLNSEDTNMINQHNIMSMQLLQKAVTQKETGLV